MYQFLTALLYQFTTARDTDLLFVLRKFYDAGNMERVYVEARDLLEDCDFNVEVAAAGMLGRDARVVARPEPLGAVRTMLQSPDTHSMLQKDLLSRAATLMLGDFVDDSDDLLAAFASQFVAEARADGTDQGGLGGNADA